MVNRIVMARSLKLLSVAGRPVATQMPGKLTERLDRGADCMLDIFCVRDIFATRVVPRLQARYHEMTESTPHRVRRPVQFLRGQIRLLDKKVDEFADRQIGTHFAGPSTFL